MRRKIIFLLFVLFFTFSMNVYATSDMPTLGELKQSLQDKLNEKKETESKTAEAKAEIAKKEAAVKQVEQEIHESESEVEKLTAEIADSNKEIERLTVEVNKTLAYLQQMKSSNAYLEYVTGAKTVTDMLMRVAAVEQTSKAIEDVMQNMRDEIKKNETLKEEEKKKQQELNSKAIEYKKVIEARYGDIKSYDKYALDIDNQIKSLQTKVADAEKKCALYAPSKGDKAVISVDCVKPPDPPKPNGGITYVENGEWLKPLTYGMITSEVGYRWGSYHNAIDIGGNAEGTPVYAAAAGVVSGKISRYYCGGNMLYIDVLVNGKAYTTYYYHLLSFNVNIGDSVTQNTIIGYVGGGRQTSASYGGYDTCTTGAHLHFGVANGFYNGYSVSRSNVIIPPGFPNSYGWRFYSRYDMYKG